MYNISLTTQWAINQRHRARNLNLIWWIMDFLICIPVYLRKIITVARPR